MELLSIITLAPPIPLCRDAAPNHAADGARTIYRVSRHSQVNYRVRGAGRSSLIERLKKLPNYVGSRRQAFTPCHIAPAVPSPTEDPRCPRP